MSGAHAFRRLQVGVDEHGLADHAVHAAVHLARLYGAELDIVHAVHLPIPHWVGSQSAEVALVHSAALERAAGVVRERLAGLEQRLGLARGEVSARLHVVAGKPATVLVDRARETQADLVLLGAHRQRGTLDFGSTARGVLHGVRTGLWLQTEEHRAIERILVPLDLSEDSLAALSAARRLAQLARAELAVLHCFPPLDFGLVGADAAVTGWPGYHVEQLASAARTGFERALAGFDWGGVPHTLAFAENDARAEILARQDECQLIVMATHGRSGVRGFLLGDVTYSVMRAAQRPVLALRHPGRAG